MSRVKLANSILDRVLGSLGLARSSKLLEAGNSVNRLSNQLSDKSHRLARAKALGILGVGSSAGASAYNTRFLKNLHADDISKLKNLHADDISKLYDQNALDMSNLRASYDLYKKGFNDTLSASAKSLDRYKKLLDESTAHSKGLSEQLESLNSRFQANQGALDSVRNQMARYNNDFTGFSDDIVLEGINQILKQHK